jgi:hypothetical protein
MIPTGSISPQASHHRLILVTPAMGLKPAGEVIGGQYLMSIFLIKNMHICCSDGEQTYGLTYARNVFYH